MISKWSAVAAVYVCATAAVTLTALASDPELTTDFFISKGLSESSLNGSYFTFTGFRNGVPSIPGKPSSLKATEIEFPALTGLGIAYFLMKFEPYSVLPPHIHPRASKLIYVISGTLSVGFTDTTNKLFTQYLKTGDVFVVPNAMVHYMANLDKSRKTLVIFSFSSSNPGTVHLPETLFASGIPKIVLEKSFDVSESVIKKLEAPYS